MPEPRGFAAILFAMGFVSLLAFLSLTMQISTGLQLRRQTSLINRQEGYGAGEILAWHSYFRQQQGLAPVGSQDERGRYIASFSNRYDDGLTSEADPYDPSNYQPGVPLNLATTLQYDSSRSLLRRYTGDNLRYLANQSGSLHCGHMIFAKKGRGICLAKGVETEKKICGGKITIKKSTPPYCKGLVTTPTGAGQPVTTISSLSELRAAITTTSGSGNYKLTQDIDCLGEACFESLITLANSVLDGNGHTIRNVGSFLTAIDNSWIINLHIENINVNVTITTGGLAVSNNGPICIDGVTMVGGSVTGAVTATGGFMGIYIGGGFQSVIRNSGAQISVMGSGNIGGLVGVGGTGLLIGDSHVCGIIQTTEPGAAGGIIGTTGVSQTISHVSTSGEVRGKNDLGGIAGILTTGSSILKSRSSAKVIGSRSIINGRSVGGLVGTLLGEIQDSYAAGDVDGLKGVGGLVGSRAAAGFGATITNCYSTGKVTSGFVPSAEFPTGPAPAPGDSGGLISGLPGSFSAASCYWDTQTSQQSGSGGGVGKTTAEMKTQATFSGWDFTNIWKMPPTDYPRLKWEP